MQVNIRIALTSNRRSAESFDNVIQRNEFIEKIILRNKPESGISGNFKNF